MSERTDDEVEREFARRQRKKELKAKREALKEPEEP